MVNGIWYTIEGDGVNATISFASTIPLVYLTSAKYIGKIVKLSDGSYSVVKFGGKSTKEFLENIQRIDLDADGLKQLNKDLADKEFAEAIVENPKLVDSWKVLDGAGVDDVVRRNIDELELVSKNIDEIKAFDGGYKAWKINNAGGSLPTRLLEGKNIFRASSQEYSLAKKSFKEYREGVIYEQSKILSGDDLTAFKNEFNGKNIAKVEGKIDDIPLDNSFRRSGDEFDGEPIFDAYKVDKEGNIDVDGAWSREWDTEYVMLSEIAKSKGAVKGGVYPKVTGEIIISSELPYCVSCQGVIQDFSDMFPNLDVILIDGLR